MDVEGFATLQQHQAGALQLLSHLEPDGIVESSPVDPAVEGLVSSCGVQLVLTHEVDRKGYWRTYL